MRMDLNKIKTMTRDSSALVEYIHGLLTEHGPGDPPYLSDLITDQGFRSGGVFVMEALEHRYNADRDLEDADQLRWRLLVLRDEWGNPPRPGEYIMRREQRKLETSPGKPLTAAELSLDKVNGDYDRKWNRYRRYKIDEKGCITCKFVDAVHFLNMWGIHGKSGAIIARHKQELSTEPVDTPSGQKMHVWYHRFKEVDKDDYAALPVIQPDNKPKRGHKNN